MEFPQAPALEPARAAARKGLSAPGRSAKVYAKKRLLGPSKASPALLSQRVEPQESTESFRPDAREARQRRFRGPTVRRKAPAVIAMAAEDNQIGHDEGLYKTLYFDYEDEVRPSSPISAHRRHTLIDATPPAAGYASRPRSPPPPPSYHHHRRRHATNAGRTDERTNERTKRA